MSLLEMICEELGVEIGEIWQGNDGHEYAITKDGELYDRDYVALTDISRLLIGEIKPVWKPKEGEFYYVPFINSIRDTEVWDSEEWGVDELYDEAMLKRGLVFKTKEEAIAAANKMIEAIKE